MRSLSLLLAIFLGVALSFDPGDYPNKVTFSSSYSLYWKINGNKFQFGAQVATLGWVGIGIGEKTSGSMPGADIAVISISGNKPVITDHYATAFEYPSVDTCQDWVLLSHEVVDGTTTMVEVERLIDTGDTQDRVLEVGPMMMVYAYGDKGDATLSYHDSRRGIYAVQFWEDPIAQPDPTESDLQTQTNLMVNFKVPTRSTTYACIAHKVPVNNNEQDKHVVRVEPILDPRTHGISHHMLVHQCIDNSPISWASLYLEKSTQCISPIGMPFSGCNTLMYGWAMGIEELNYPPDVGARMGFSRAAFQYIVIEMHYANPDGIRGLVDSTGYKMFYTSRLRKYDGATLTTGDPFISFPSIPAHSPSEGRESTCPAQCTRQFKDDIHIFISALHMHVSGSQMWTTHFRDDKYLGTISRSDFFAFDNQHTNYVNVTVRKGDSLNTHCVFNTADRTRPTAFGYASFSEMCMDFLGYYPRQEFGLSGMDFSYCGWFGWFGPHWTLCGSNFGFMTGQSIMPLHNPSNSDLESTRAIVFGTEPNSCLAKKD